MSNCSNKSFNQTEQIMDCGQFINNNDTFITTHYLSHKYLHTKEVETIK